MTAPPSASVDGRLEIPEGICVLTHEVLKIDDIIASVGSHEAGATAVFIGTTRNSFKGRAVTRLDYQAYTKLALKTMADILHTAHSMHTRSAHQQQPSPSGVPTTAIIRSVVHHRLGTVPVGEPSIVIAVSSPHRKEAFMACELILEEVKLKAQIWKREFYEGDREEEAEWKANIA